MLRMFGFVCLLALVPVTGTAAEEPRAISSSSQMCIKNPSHYKFTFEVGIDGVRGTIRRHGRVLNFEISRYPGPDKFEDNFKEWHTIARKELPSTLSLVAEYSNPEAGAEKLYGFSADDVYVGGKRQADRIYIKLWANTKHDAESLLPQVGASLYRCNTGSYPIQKGVP